MSQPLTIALAQINTTVGDIAGNSDKIQQYYEQAAAQKADLVIFPELSLIGYSPEDLILRPSFQQKSIEFVHLLAKKTKESATAMIVGNLYEEGGKLFNAAFLMKKGGISGVHRKHSLPNYGVFDELRTFTPAPLPDPIPYRDLKLGMLICEDIWQRGAVEALSIKGAEMIIVINASPFERSKHQERLRIVKEHAKQHEVPFIYVNMMGGQDEVVFDGSSFVCNHLGEIVQQLPAWEESLALTHWQKQEGKWHYMPEQNARALTSQPSTEENLYCAMMTGLRDYLQKTGFRDVVLGLSGGIDSALTATIAVDVLGKDHVHVMMLPSRYTSDESLLDAQHCAENLGLTLHSLPILDPVQSIEETLAPYFVGRATDITEENIQSRIRGVLLMALSNKFGWLLLTTGNKSELATGYATLYGDMCGGFNLLKDLYKTEVYNVARWRNHHLPKGALGIHSKVIPDSVLMKAPTAELRPNQKDSDSLPRYELLDDILIKLIEKQCSPAVLIETGYDRKIVEKVNELLYVSEYKRKQSAPGVKVSSMHFGKDRRYPICHSFRD